MLKNNRMGTIEYDEYEQIWSKKLWKHTINLGIVIRKDFTYCQHNDSYRQNNHDNFPA